MATIRRVASSIAMPVFLRLCVSEAETPMQNSSTPHAMPRSRPRSLSTRPESVTPSGFAARRREVREEPVGVGHLRHLLRVDEGAELDDVEPGAEEGLGPDDLLLGRDRALLHLETVAQPHLVEHDLRLAGHGAPPQAAATGTLAAIARARSRVVALPPMS